MFGYQSREGIVIQSNKKISSSTHLPIPWDFGGDRIQKLELDGEKKESKVETKKENQDVVTAREDRETSIYSDMYIVAIFETKQNKTKPYLTAVRYFFIPTSGY